MNLPVIILGCGGHAKVLISTLLLLRREILGYVEPDEGRGAVFGLSRLGDDKAILKYDPNELSLVNGVGSISSPVLRKNLYEHFRNKGYCFESVVHPSSIVSSDVRLDEGVQIMAGAVVQPGSCMGTNSIVNTGALIDHDCEIGAHVHIAPGAVLSGNVRIANEVHVGTGAVIIQGLVIGAKSVIGAGSVVINDVPAGVTIVGIPGRIICNHAAK